MMHPSQRPNRPEPDPDAPYPDVRGAFLLTLAAIVAAAFTGIAFIDFGLLAAVGIGQAIGVGAVATVGARRVPEPQAARLGLRALDSSAIPMILCLAPAILLVSELDNFAVDFTRTDSASSIEVSSESAVEAEASAVPESATRFDLETRFDSVEATEDAGRSSASAENLETTPDGGALDGTPDASSSRDPSEASDGSEAGEKPRPLIDPEDPWILLQAFIVMVGISPVVEEFLFRGVIQQGLVQRMGMLRGVTLCAFLWMLLRPAPLGGFTRFAATAVGSFGLGWLLGIVRIATGSILGPMLLASVWAAIGLGSLAMVGRLDLPGMNIESTHLPVTVTGASLLVVGWAGAAMFREARERFAEGGPGAGGAGGGPSEDEAKEPTSLFR